MPTLEEPPEQQRDALENEDPNRPSEALQTQAERAYRLILNGIFRGDLLPTYEKPLSEVILKDRYERLGIGSRMPIRMALAVLASEGLVAQEARHGFWVVDYTAHDLRQIGAMRADTDAMVASFLRASISGEGVTTERDFQRVYHSLEIIADSRRRMELLATQAPQGTVDLDVEIQFASHDTRFHTFIAAATDYMLAARHIQQWRNLIRLYRAQHQIHYTGQELLAICAEHELLIQLAARPTAERFEGIDVEIEHRAAMIEQAATAHVTASLSRAGVGEETDEETNDTRDESPSLTDDESGYSQEESRDEEGREVREKTVADDAAAKEFRARLQTMARRIRTIRDDE